MYLTDYQINIVSKEHQNAIIFSGPDKEKNIYLFLHDNHYDVITSMPAFYARKRYIVTPVKNRMIKQWSIYVPMHVNVVVFQIVRFFCGFPVLIVIVCLRVISVLIATNKI
jgi:hypothetical protein